MLTDEEKKKKSCPFFLKEKLDFFEDIAFLHQKENVDIQNIRRVKTLQSVHFALCMGVEVKSVVNKRK